MQGKAIIVPPLGHRWVQPSQRVRVWGKRIYRHMGASVLTIPKEVRALLGWEAGDIVIMQVVGDELRIHKPAALLNEDDGGKS